MQRSRRENLVIGNVRKIVHDKNGNKKWDSGDLLKHIQPEIVEFNPELITVRANWDVDVKWDLNYKKPVLK